MGLRLSALAAFASFACSALSRASWTYVTAASAYRQAQRAAEVVSCMARNFGSGRGRTLSLGVCLTSTFRGRAPARVKGARSLIRSLRKRFDPIHTALYFAKPVDAGGASVRLQPGTLS
jgi:hypothetical protein